MMLFFSIVFAPIPSIIYGGARLESGVFPGLTYRAPRYWKAEAAINIQRLRKTSALYRHTPK